MPDLYAALGIPPDADADTIKRAYRNAARKAHPDAGGDRKRFDLIILARDTLTDDARRARYDETGEIGEKPVDNHQSGVMSMLSAGLDAALSKLYQKAQPPIQSDMPGLVKAEMAELRRKWNGERTELRKAIVITRELLGRWSAKGDNVTSGDLLQVQTDLQKWTLTTNIQSTLTKELGDALKGIIQKAG